MIAMKETGIFSWYGFMEPFEQRLAQIRQAGFDGVTLWWEDETGEYPYDRRQMADAVANHSLQVFNVHMAGLDSDELWCDSDQRRRAYLYRVEKTIAEMAADDLHLLVMHLCEHGDVPAPNVQLLRSLERLVRVVEDHHSVLSLENTMRADYIDLALREFDVPQISFCYDTSHAQLRDQQSLLTQWAMRLSACHLADNDLQEDRHWLPGDGAIEFAPLLPPLAAAAIPLTLEVVADRRCYDDAAAYLLEARRRLAGLVRDADKGRQDQGDLAV